VALEPASGRKVREDAGCQKGEADGEGTDDPIELHAPLEHEPIKQGQDEDEHSRFGKE